MNAVALMVATALLGVDYGWHRLPNGEWEYIIQVEPALVDTLVQGQALVSQMPPELQGVRRFRVQVGEGEIPREQLPATPIAVIPDSDPSRRTPGGVGGLSSGFNPGSNFSGSNFSGQGGAGVRGPNGLTNGLAGALAGGWPIGVDPRAMATLRTYEWVSLQPIALAPLENEFLRQWGGPDPTPVQERPWEQFSSTRPPSSRWPGAGGRADDGGAAPPSAINDLVRQWNERNGGPIGGGAGADRFPASRLDGAGRFDSRAAANPWQLDQFGARGATGRGRGAAEPADGDDPEYGGAGVDGDVQRFDLNGPRAGSSRSGSSQPSGAWPLVREAPGSREAMDRGRGGGRATGQLASRSTQRGVLEERERSNWGGAPAEGRSGATNGAGARHDDLAARLTSTRGPRGLLSEESVGSQVWWPLTMTVVLLFASLGGNLYLGWLALDFYRRYREAAWELRAGDGPV